MNGKIIALLLFLFLIVSLSCSLPPLVFEQEQEGPVLIATDTPVLEPTTEPPTEQPAIQDCGTDLDCFFQAADNCQKTAFSYQNTLDFMGMLITTHTRFEVQGMDGDQCIFHVLTENVETAYSEEARQQLLDQGQTEEDIQTQEESIREQQLATGFDDTCRGYSYELIAMLEGWEQGSFSTEDWDPFECEGKIFSAAAGPLPTETSQVLEPSPSVEPYPTEVQPERRDNQILNASFENDPGTTVPIWIVETRNTDVEAKWVEAESKIGQYSLMLSATNHANKGNPGWFLSEMIPVNGGEWYLYYAWAMSPDGASSFMSAEKYDQDKNLITTQGTGCRELEQGAWTRVGFGMNLEEDVAFLRLGMQQCFLESAGVKTHLYYDEVYLGQTGQ